MALWTWWPGDDLPALAPLDDIRVDSQRSVDELTSLTGLDEDEIQARIVAGNRCYVAQQGQSLVAYGWVAAAEANIGELELPFELDRSNRYLWDFQTLPAWRGRGIYPRLLQAILSDQGLEDHRFWIITAPENLSSARGIHKAGFQRVADLAFTQEGPAGLVATDSHGRGSAGAAVLGVPVVDSGHEPRVSPCWCCVIDALRMSSSAACWAPGAFGNTSCTCGQS